MLSLTHSVEIQLNTMIFKTFGWGEFTHKINYISPVRANWNDFPLSIQTTIKEAKKDQKYQQLINIIKNKQPLSLSPNEYKNVIKNLEIKQFEEGQIFTYSHKIGS